MERPYPYRKEGYIWLIVITSFANGLFIILQHIFRRFPQFLDINRILIPNSIYYFSKTLTLLIGFMFLYFSFELYQKKRMAWMLSVIISFVVIIANIGKVSGLHEYVLPFFMIIILFIFKDRFTVISGPTNIRKGVMLAVFSISIAIAYGIIGFYMLHKMDFGMDFNLLDSFTDTIRELTLIGNPDLVPHTAHARWFIKSLDAFGLTALLFAVYSLFKPLSYRLFINPLEREIAEDISKRHGASSIDYFRLLDDKSYFFSATKRSFIAYSTKFGCAVTLGDPVGPKNEIDGITKEFLGFCKDNDLKVAFFQTLPDNIDMYKRLGLKGFKVGQEAMVDLGEFSAKTINLKEFKRIKKNFDSQGFEVEMLSPPHNPDFIDVLKTVSDEWLSLPNRKERKFSIGKFDEQYINKTTVFGLRDPKGRLIAFVNLAPSYIKDQAAIDLMRHRKHIPNGTMDYLFTCIMETLHKQGYERLSLGGVMLTGIGETKDNPIEEKTLNWASKRLNRVFSYNSLRNYKSKFNPNWEDRYIVYAGKRSDLIPLAIAIISMTE